MVDALWIAASGVSYAMSEGARPNVVILGYYIDRHPCDDEVYVADIRIMSHYADGVRLNDGDGCAT
jgi:hypothetical protein